MSELLTIIGNTVSVIMMLCQNYIEGTKII